MQAPRPFEHFDRNRNSPEAEPATPLSSQLGHSLLQGTAMIPVGAKGLVPTYLTLVLQNPQPVDTCNW